ncbi:DUF2243 domain-containing protein [Rhodoligotrophos defluvii]|uniref:DUF2243 domain-containing protein n=1 Tax=Rhodoligotrophos defluvii TaxID=2561934 RepID=UPI0010C9A3C8|nr:DUF2243 domain-containing protein [Rhodoligotrophos defluvii]
MAGFRRSVWAAYLLGFALGGFFDGILLHQILQWHHLLSLVEGVGDLRAQVIYDGLFHALMYVIGLAGLILLLGARQELRTLPGSGILVGSALIGFGAWHVADAVLSHWLLGIHRIKLDSPNPLLWDLFWFVLFGLLPIALGWQLRNQAQARGGPRPGAGTAASCLLVAAMGMGWWAALGPQEPRSAIVVFPSSVSDRAAMTAIAETDGRVLWLSGGIWAVTWNERMPPAVALYGRGAMLVSGRVLGAGCLAWLKA